MKGVVQKKDFSVTFLPEPGQILSRSGEYWKKSLFMVHSSQFSAYRSPYSGSSAGKEITNEMSWVRARASLGQYPESNGNKYMRVRDKRKKRANVQGDFPSLQWSSAQTFPQLKVGLCFRGHNSFLSRESF